MLCRRVCVARLGINPGRRPHVARARPRGAHAPVDIPLERAVTGSSWSRTTTLEWPRQICAVRCISSAVPEPASPHRSLSGQASRSRHSPACVLRCMHLQYFCDSGHHRAGAVSSFLYHLTKTCCSTRISLKTMSTPGEVHGSPACHPRDSSTLRPPPIVLCFEISHVQADVHLRGATF